MGCLLQGSPKFYNNVFLLADFSTLGTFIKFDLVVDKVQCPKSNVLFTICNLQKGLFCVSTFGMYINLTAIVLSLQIPEYIAVIFKVYPTSFNPVDVSISIIESSVSSECTSIYKIKSFINISSMASKLNNIRFEPALSHTEKSCIASFFRQFSKSLNVRFLSLGLSPFGVNKTGFNLIISQFNTRRKLSIIRCNKELYFYFTLKPWDLRLGIGQWP